MTRYRLLLLVLATILIYVNASYENKNVENQIHRRVPRDCGCGKATCRCPPRPPGSKPWCTCDLPRRRPPLTRPPCSLCGAPAGRCNCMSRICQGGYIDRRPDGLFCCYNTNKESCFQMKSDKETDMIVCPPGGVPIIGGVSRCCPGGTCAPKETPQPKYPEIEINKYGSSADCSDGKITILGGNRFCCRGDICDSMDHKTEAERVTLQKVPCPGTEFKMEDAPAADEFGDEEFQDEIADEFGDEEFQDENEEEPRTLQLQCEGRIIKRGGEKFCCTATGCTLLQSADEERTFSRRLCLGGQHIERNGIVYCCRFGRCRIVWSASRRVLDEVALDVPADEFQDELGDVVVTKRCSGKTVNVEGKGYCCKKNGCTIIEGDDESVKQPTGPRKCKGGEIITTGSSAYCCRYGRCALVWTGNEKWLHLVAHDIPAEQMLKSKQGVKDEITVETTTEVIKTGVVYKTPNPIEPTDPDAPRTFELAAHKLQLLRPAASLPPVSQPVTPTPQPTTPRPDTSSPPPIPPVTTTAKPSEDADRFWAGNPIERYLASPAQSPSLTPTALQDLSPFFPKLSSLSQQQLQVLSPLNKLNAVANTFLPNLPTVMDDRRGFGQLGQFVNNTVQQIQNQLQGQLQQILSSQPGPTPSSTTPSPSPTSSSTTPSNGPTPPSTTPANGPIRPNVQPSSTTPGPIPPSENRIFLPPPSTPLPTTVTSSTPPPTTETSTTPPPVLPSPPPVTEPPTQAPLGMQFFVPVMGFNPQTQQNDLGITQQTGGPKPCQYMMTARAISTLRKVAPGMIGFATLSLSQREGCNTARSAIARLAGVENNVRYGIEVGDHKACGAQTTNSRPLVRTAVIGNNLDNHVQFTVTSLDSIKNQPVTVTTLDSSGKATPYACGRLFILPSLSV